MATFQTSPPENFEFSKPDEWQKWIRRLERFRVASGLSKKDEPSQINTLIYSMGDRADDILHTFTLTEEEEKKYSVIVDKFEAHFVKKRNVIFERAKFNQRSQQPGESVEAFITSLHSLAEHCSYGELREEMIRDRIVVGLQNGRLAEKLQLTLEKAVNQARQSEAVKNKQVVRPRYHIWRRSKAKG